MEFVSGDFLSTGLQSDLSIEPAFLPGGTPEFGLGTRVGDPGVRVRFPGLSGRTSCGVSEGYVFLTGTQWRPEQGDPSPSAEPSFSPGKTVVFGLYNSSDLPPIARSNWSGKQGVRQWGILGDGSDIRTIRRTRTSAGRNVEIRSRNISPMSGSTGRLFPACRDEIVGVSGNWLFLTGS